MPRRAAAQVAKVGAAAPTVDDDEDPLDRFMREQVEKEAEKEAEKAAKHAAAWQAQYGDKDVQVACVHACMRACVGRVVGGSRSWGHGGLG